MMTKLSYDVIQLLQGKTMVTAESCTGGGIGAALTAVPGDVLPAAGEGVDGEEAVVLAAAAVLWFPSWKVRPVRTSIPKICAASLHVVLMIIAQTLAAGVLRNIIRDSHPCRPILAVQMTIRCWNLPVWSLLATPVKIFIV